MKKILITLIILLTGFSLQAQNPYDTAIAILQPITMVHTNCGANRINGNYWIQDCNGTVSTSSADSVNFPVTGSYRFDFTGHGAPHGVGINAVWPHIYLKIDNVFKDSLVIDNNLPDLWSTTFNVTSGKHKISITFVNDNGSVNFAVFMVLLYIYPNVKAGSNLPIKYPAIVKQTKPVYGSRFLTSNDFQSGFLRGSCENTKGNHPLEPSDMDDLGAYGADIFRYWIAAAINGSFTNYTFIPGDIDTADARIKECAKNKMYINIVITEGPDNTYENYWGHPQAQDSFIVRAKYVANRYKDSTEVACYSLLNEPGLAGVLGEHERFIQRIISAIRSVDTNHVILVGGPTGASSNDLYTLTEAQPYNNLIYEYHSYKDFKITHQGGPFNPQDSLRQEYPNTPSSPYFKQAYLGTFGDSELSVTLQMVRDFAAKYNSPILIGEFSCAGWSPNNSSPRYIAASIAKFELMSWAWSYFSYRKYEMQNAELSDSLWEAKCTFRGATPLLHGTTDYTDLDQYRSGFTPAMTILRNYWALNNPVSDQPGISIADTSVTKCTDSFAIVRAYLDKTYSADLTVSYQTISGTAIPPKDYKSSSGTIRILAGSLKTNIKVAIVCNHTVGSKILTMKISNPANGTIVKNISVITINSP